jgi:hypothetical protein
MALGCASRSGLTVRSIPSSEAPVSETADGGAPAGIALRADAGVASAEVAWLVAHLAEEPDRANPRESDAVRRLARAGPAGVHAVAEVLRAGDALRAPFARRVLERVALERCRRDLSRAAARLARLQRPDAGVASDAGFVWWSADDARWASEAVERIHAWASAGLPCEDVPPTVARAALADASADAP